MKIEKVVIACFRKDLFLLRSCVGSIRYWYPDIPIELLKDTIQGDFSTVEIERAWNVGIYPSSRKNFGWPWSKLDIILNRKKERVLFLDSDTVLLGPVLDFLDSCPEDFVVTGIREPDGNSAAVTAHYIDMARMRDFDPAYVYPGFAFNGGQMVMTSGVIDESALESVIDLGEPIRNRYPEMLKHGDQGALNYALAKAAARGSISLGYTDFWAWPGMPATQHFNLDSIRRREGYPIVLHWAGIKPVDHRKYIRADILRFFTTFYYSRVRHGRILRALREVRLQTIAMMKITKYKILGWEYV